MAAANDEADDASDERWPLCAELNRIRARARQDVLQFWTQDALTTRIVQRLKVIDEQLLKHQQRQQQQQQQQQQQDSRGRQDEL